MTVRRPLVAGNWKMNGLRAGLAELSLMAVAYDAPLRRRVDLLVCPPATLLNAAAHLALGSGIRVGAQDCAVEVSGAFTGELSAEMVADGGAAFVIVGHSERRTLHGETDEVVRAKADAALRAGLTPIVCVGETRAERDSGRAQRVVQRQIDRSLPIDVRAEDIVVAYEPVWAIGTGLTPTLADVGQMHGFIRQRLRRRLRAGAESVRLLYGGSVKPSNAAELMRVADVDGALVGGASLTADDFMAIATAYSEPD